MGLLRLTSCCWQTRLRGAGQHVKFRGMSSPLHTPVSAMSVSAPPVRQWSTDAVVAAERLDYWVGAICEAFLEMDCGSREGAAFSGQLTSVGVGALHFNQVIASSQEVYRTPGAIARGQQHPFYLITQMSHGWHVRQGGHFVQLRPGDAVLVDSAQRYELHFPHDVACLSVQLPRSWVGQWLTEVDIAQPRVVHRDQGWGQALSGLAVQLGRDPALALAYPSHLLCDQMGAALSAVLEPVVPHDAPTGLWGQVQAALRDRLSVPGLTALDVAQAVGVSLRTLHRCFTANHASFAASLRVLRMSQAKVLMANRSLARLSLAEIGLRCGYADASHFARDFHRAVGLTPAVWRKQSLNS